ncbi:hypothetical protein AsFPU1_3975 [Aphanothece sacrum FPU1]|uniref:Uncharacterized protein n=1 Tax=Aphanothece sacrum FPU1 TaxID=1920663 RepID=A0A401IMS6_APHSA|nr:hypothetical protein AsFPU1_3975 [Aphanothece sacrum FPU1]GBF84679.1 hypothetical protein AsFPU3_1733 [Aphanothece sacrum FPU3]
MKGDRWKIGPSKADNIMTKIVIATKFNEVDSIIAQINDQVLISCYIHLHNTNEDKRPAK